MEESNLLRIAVAAMLSLAAVVCHPAAGQRVAGPNPTPVADFSIATGCDPAPTLTLKWRASRSALARQRLEISAHKDGFRSGLFATLTPIVRGARTRPSGASALPPAFFRTALALSATTVEADARAESVHVELAGLQANLYYSLRVATRDGDRWTPGPIFQQEITVCIDEEDEEGRR